MDACQVTKTLPLSSCWSSVHKSLISNTSPNDQNVVSIEKETFGRLTMLFPWKNIFEFQLGTITRDSVIPLPIEFFTIGFSDRLFDS